MPSAIKGVTPARDVSLVRVSSSRLPDRCPRRSDDNGPRSPLPGELEIPAGIFGDDPPVDVGLRVPSLNVFLQRGLGVEIAATEIAAVVSFGCHW